MIPDSVKQAFEPYAWKVRFVKNGRYGLLKYEEKGRKPAKMSAEDFMYAVKETNEISRVLKLVDPHYRFKIYATDDGYITKMKLRASADLLAGSLAMEFLQHSHKLQHMIRWKQAKMFLAGYFIGFILGILAAAAYFLFKG